MHSTFFGADGTTTPYAIVNNDGKGVYLTGSTSSGHLPGGPVLTPNPTAGFVTKFDVDLSQVRYTQLLGLVVSGAALRGTASAAPQIYTTGWRYTGGHDIDHEDAFVVKLEENTSGQQDCQPARTNQWSVLYCGLVGNRCFGRHRFVRRLRFRQWRTLYRISNREHPRTQRHSTEP